MNKSYIQNVFASNSITAIKCISFNPLGSFYRPKGYIFQPFHILQLAKSLPFHKSKALKKYPFWVEPKLVYRPLWGPPPPPGCSLTEIMFLASNDNFFTSLGGTSDRLFLAGVCSSVLRSLEFMTVACSLTWSYCFFIKPLDTNLSTIASASLWSLN